MNDRDVGRLLPPRYSVGQGAQARQELTAKQANREKLERARRKQVVGGER